MATREAHVKVVAKLFWILGMKPVYPGTWQQRRQDQPKAWRVCEEAFQGMARARGWDKSAALSPLLFC